MTRIRRCEHGALWLGLLLLILLFTSKAHGADPVLAADDEKLLSSLIGNPLFDPEGAQRVQVKSRVRSVWASVADDIEREGWLVTRGGEEPRVFFTDGDSMPLRNEEDAKHVDFLATCRDRLAREVPPVDEERSTRTVFGRMQQTAVGLFDESDLVLAAWLNRLGKKELAAKTLMRARSQGKEADLATLRAELAWSAFAGLVHAYMVRADEEALRHGERLLKLYPKEVEKDYPQSNAIVEDLRRRKEEGTFGREREQNLPEGFEQWEVKKKLEHLIQSLDEVDSRQWGQPGNVPLTFDRRVSSLIAIGDGAVPDLIDTIEKDKRLTRSVHFWRDFGRSRTVLGVREAALTAVMSILQVRVFEPRSTGDNFTTRGEEGTKQVVAQLRAYWKKYGNMQADDRMMRILTDPGAALDATREAAGNLAQFGTRRTLSTTVFGDRIAGHAKKPNPAIAKFNNPTAAEAILAAMDRDLTVFDKTDRIDLSDYERRRIEDAYLFPLIDLGDARIATVLAIRGRDAATVRMRRKWAYACHWLGDPKPLADFATEFRDGKIKLPPNDRPNTNDDDQPGAVELDGIVEYLAAVRSSNADQALMALADPRHPSFSSATKRVLSNQIRFREEDGWFASPFCLVILRRALDDTTPNGTIMTIESDQVAATFPNGSSSSSIPDVLSDLRSRRDEVKVRVCDAAAEKLSTLVIGLPEYHPLLNDSEDRLRAVRSYFERFQKALRRTTSVEDEIFDNRLHEPMFVPDFAGLEGPATATDVSTGKAVFHLNGRGIRTMMTLPASAVARADEKKPHAARVLIVQAEEDSNGDLIYGIIGRREIAALPARDLVQIKSVGAAGDQSK